MPDLRTGLTVTKLVDDIQQDIQDASDLILRGTDILHALQEPVRGIKDLPSFLKSKVTELRKLLTDLDDESKKVNKTLLGTIPLPSVVINVDPTVNEPSMDPLIEKKILS